MKRTTRSTIIHAEVAPADLRKCVRFLNCWLRLSGRALLPMPDGEAMGFSAIDCGFTVTDSTPEIDAKLSTLLRRLYVCLKEPNRAYLGLSVVTKTVDEAAEVHFVSVTGANLPRGIPSVAGGVFPFFEPVRRPNFGGLSAGFFI